MKYLICNLKANKTYDEMRLYKDILMQIRAHNTKIILAPSTPFLPIFTNTGITLSTQNINLNNELLLTGDISINALKSLNVSFTIIGHFERRKYYNETNKDILDKIKLALKNKLKVIYCIGETKEELDRKVEYQVLEKSIATILNNIPKEQFENIIIAYEPTYLIGSNEKINIDKIYEMISFIKNIVTSYYHTPIKVVFGGNITPDNINKLNKIEDLDGFIIGHAALDPTNIKTIIDNID